MEANFITGNEEQFQLKQKLQTILSTLLQENLQVQEFYTAKISQLYEEISTKDSTISSLEEQLKFMDKKYTNLERQFSKKQTMVNKLSRTIEGLQRKFKQSIHNYIQQLDFSFNETYSKTNQKELSEHKRINISEYFIKTAQRSKEVTRCDQDISSESSTFSTLYPSRNMNFFMPKKKNQPLITKVKSMDQQKFSQYVSCFLQNQSNQISPSKRSPVQKRGRNSKVQELLKTPKSTKWKNLSGIPDHCKRGYSKFLHY